MRMKGSKYCFFTNAFIVYGRIKQASCGCNCATCLLMRQRLTGEPYLVFFVMFEQEIIVRILLHMELLYAAVEKVLEVVDIQAFTG